MEAETAALAQPWGRRLWEWAQAAGMDAAGGFYVAKPSAVGRGGRPGDNVIMARGLPAIVLAAQKLLALVCMVCPCSTPEIQSSCSVAGLQDVANTSLVLTELRGRLPAGQFLVFNTPCEERGAWPVVFLVSLLTS